jgi:predicted SprT family Zn-dependent metalloprotease
MTKSDFKRFARTEMSKLGLDGWTVKFNGRIKRAVGKCKPRKKRIDLSKAYFVEHGGELPDEMLKDVVLHEIAHALDYERRGTSDHSRKWKRVAREVGANPSRTANVPEELIAKVADWKRECPKCGWEAYYHSKPTAEGHMCPECHRDFHPRSEKLEYVLDIKPNN